MEHDFINEHRNDMKTTSSMPSSLTTIMPPGDDTQQHILIASFVGVAVILVMIFLCLLYCYNRRHPMHGQFRHSNRNNSNRNNSNRNTSHSVCISDPPPINVYENKTMQYSDIDGNLLSHDISIKLKTPWDDMYGNMESEKFKTLRDQLIESVEDLYKHYCEFRGAILLKLRQGSVIADLRLKFSKLAVEPLNIIKSAVSKGWCRSFEVENDYFIVEKWLRQQSRSDKTESGYGSQVFEQITFVEKVEQKSFKKSDKFASNRKSPPTRPTSSVRSTPEMTKNKHNIEVKADKHVGRSSSSRRVRSKKRNIAASTDTGFREGMHHVARFNFSPQDDRELALQQGEAIYIKSVHPDGWVKVVNESGKEGWVPRNFIAEIDPEHYVNTKKAVESIIFLDQVIESVDACDDQEIDSITHEAKSSPIVSNNSYENVPSDNEVFGETLNGVFVVIFPFEPTDTKEIKLEVGDLIDVSKVSETGWWKGRCIRTNLDGWFPSTYVKPKSAEINFKTFFGDLAHESVKESVSDSELHTSKRSPLSSNGYHSDNEENKVKDDSMLRSCVSENCIITCESEEIKETEDIEETEGIKKDKHEDKVKTNSFSDTPLVPTKPPYVRSFSDTPACGPPAKPVPPKPRKSHMIQTYQKLFANDQFCSPNELITRSMECLHITPKAGGHRRSEETSASGGNAEEMFSAGPIQRDRPLSCQSGTRFLQLSNSYASHMKSWSLPSLCGDQIKLSPDDDRPYHQPIPRKSKVTSVDVEHLSNLHDGEDSGEYLELKKDSDEYLELNKPDITKRLKPKESKQCSQVAQNEDQITSPKTNDTDTAAVVDAPPPLPQRESMKYGFSVKITSNDNNTKQKENSLSSLNSYNNKNFVTTTIQKSESTEEGVCKLTSPSTETETAANSSPKRILNTKKDIREEIILGVLSEHGNVCDDKFSAGKTTDQHKHLPSSQNQNTFTSELKNVKYHSNVNSTKLNSHVVVEKNKLSCRILNSCGEESEDSTSRTSSTFSLASSFNSSMASSGRSTISSKYEQMNLRRAIASVCGKGVHDLSFDKGALLYELRPRNKEGLCYGLLEDSTQGWYPSEAVESFQERV